MKRIRKTISLIITFALLFSLATAFPAQTAAAASGAWDGTVDISWYDPAKTEYYIGTPAQLAGLAALVNGMTDPACPKIVGDKAHLKSVARPNSLLVGAGGGNVSDTVYLSNLDFSYKTVYLTADLDMGGVYKSGKWTGPNWTPIGGKFPMKPKEIKGDCLVLDTRFNGVLNGQGHTVSNIYCDRYAEKGFPYSMAAGLVGFLGGVADNESDGFKTFENGWQPSVKNVVVGKGFIYARRMVGGVVGRAGSTSNGIIIENCANFADIHNTDSKGIGGIIGSGWGSGTIRNCYNAGSVTTTYACPAGGICGSNQGLDIYNCYNTGKIDSNNQQRGRGIGGHDSGSYKVLNCYYLEGCDDDPASNGWYKGTSQKITTDIKSLSAKEMKTQDFVDKLNPSGASFAADSGNINQGYPVLFFQAKGYAQTANVTITARQPASGGTFTISTTGPVPAGQTVTLTASPADGFSLKHFTLNGNQLAADFFTASSDSEISAVFYKVSRVKLAVPASNDSYYSFARTGYEPTGDKTTYVTKKSLKNGDTLLEGNVIHVTAVPYPGAVPEDVSTAYTGSYNIAATNAVKNDDGSFTVMGTGDVVFTITQNTGKKSWITDADTSWYTGQANSYTIKTGAQLAGLAKLVNTDGIRFNGITVSLGNDISLANSDGMGERVWEAIGKNSARYFAGNFDGKGFTVYDMTAENDGSYAGLFGYISSAEVKNVTVRGSVSGMANTAYAAGIVSYASGSKIENCTNRAQVTAGGTGAGGIAAYIADESTVTGCVNRGVVSGTSGVGGVVGISYSAEDTISNCQNYGEVRASGDDSYGTGGIAGQLSGIMTGCGNFAAVTSGDRYTGGLAGYTASRLGSKISNSINGGAVTSSNKNAASAAGSAVGYAQYLNIDNVSAPGKPVGKEGEVTKGTTVNAGLLPAKTTDDDKWQHPAAKKPPWTVTFMADGKIAGTETYATAAQKIKEPAIPAKPGHTASWAKYRLETGDIIVQAVYRPAFTKGGTTIQSGGVYFPDPGSGGQIAIADGISVTVDGRYGTCDDLTLYAGKGVSLTLENLTMKGTKTLMVLNGGSLTLTGKNALLNSSDTKGNENPTLKMSGAVKIAGGGELYVKSDIGNAAVMLETGAFMELASGTLSVFKSGLLGVSGGSLCANDASVTISGGVFNGYSNSDNVSVISAKQFKITGGTVRVQAAKSPVAIDSKTATIAGGTLYCAGHTGNSSDTEKSYIGAQAVSGITGATAGRFENTLPFGSMEITDSYFETAVVNQKSAY